jgi:hypothetical protein
MSVSRSIVICAGLFLSTIGIAMAGPPFPRIATVNYSAPQNYDSPAFQAQLAKFNIAILSYWPGWNNGRSMTMEQSVQAIKRINPNELVFLYVINKEINPNYSVMAEPIQKIEAMHWWLYPNGKSGNPVPSVFPGTLELNNTMFATPDSNGDRWVDWFAKWVARTYYQPNPAIDGLFTDGVFWTPRVNGDWNLDGVTDSDRDPKVGQWYRQGYAHHFAVLYQQMPGKLQIGNIADWGAGNGNISGYQGIMNGGFFEGIIGNSYSPETWGGWSEMMREYRVGMNAVSAPKLVILGQAGVANDYQGMRYGLTSCLMDDGYYQFSLESNNYSGVLWFDEYGAKLGNAVSGPQTSAWQNGVYRRDFDNGIALVNPKGNGTRTVQLEASFVRLSGSQDPTTNNGQTVRTVTLKDRDGIILMRTGASASSTPPANSKPLPPASVVVQ